MTMPEMLAALGLEVSLETVPRLEQLVDELLRWNRRRNLTAITSHQDVLEKHLVDSLALLPFLRFPGRLLDLGSGAGFPALPLKITCPALEVVSVDAVAKKIAFQRHIARRLGLERFTALHQRIEALADRPGYGKGFDMVTARALCSLEQLLDLAEPLLSVDGCLLAMKGPDGDREVAALEDRLKRSGGSAMVHPFKLPFSGAERRLVEVRF